MSFWHERLVDKHIVQHGFLPLAIAKKFVALGCGTRYAAGAEQNGVIGGEIQALASFREVGIMTGNTTQFAGLPEAIFYEERLDIANKPAFA